MRIGGIIDASTKDIPHKAAMVIFCVGCNFKCEFCHNKYLLYPTVGKEVEVSELIKKVKENVLINGISFTGGEPTLQTDIVEVCQQLSTLGKFLSIDTNGSNPNVIKNLFPYINRVALDLKGPLVRDRLEKIVGVKIALNTIRETFNLINANNEIEFEIRTTFLESILTPLDIDRIVGFLLQNKFRGNFVLQQYQYSEGVGEKFKDIFHKPEHSSLVNILNTYKNITLPFKIYIRDDIVGYRDINNLY